MTTNPLGKSSGFNDSSVSDRSSRAETISYFILTVLGFSFWFLMVVPFASHRETYWWLAMVHSQPFSYAFGFITSTYRPLAQVATWLAFRALNPDVFPTSVLRQALLQGFIYAMFVLAWWFIYRAARERRLFALIAFVAGGVFFSGYVHLFHVYGVFYVPVILTLAGLLSFYASGTFQRREIWFAAVTTLLVFWHPFATALFVGFYFGFYLETFWQRGRAQHVQAVLILLVGMTAVAMMVVIFPRITTMVGSFPRTVVMPLDSRLFGFLVSYQTNEVNRFASLVAFLLAQTVIFSMQLSPRTKLVAVLLLSVLSGVFLLKGLPLLLLWLAVVLIKLFRLRYWGMFFLMGTAVLLPFGGGIGTPIYVLFAIIVATYVTALGWARAEKVFSVVKTGYVVAAIVATTLVILLVRVGIRVPIVTRVASPLLTERERTYQLEDILAWLHNSEYCGYEISFPEKAGSPVDSLETAISRKNRPPAQLEDVQLFWKTVLQCRMPAGVGNQAGTAVVTFGAPALANSSPVYEVKGRYAGDAAVWIRNSQN
jgi:hypothetical protein